MMRANILVGLLLSVLVTGCKSTREAASSPIDHVAKGQVQIFYLAGRYGAIEACGCSMRPLGGIQREWNALERYRSATAAASFYFTSGPVFFGKIPARELSVYRAQSEVLVEGLNALKVNGYAVSVDDLELGEDFLVGLAKKTTFPLLSANIIDKKTAQPLFKSFAVHEVNGKKILVTAVSRPSVPGRKFKRAVIADPMKSLAQVFSQAGEGFSLVILLSELRTADRQRLQAAFPRVNLIFGGDGGTYDSVSVQEGPTLVRAEPDAQGRVLAMLELDLEGAKAPKQFFSTEASRRTSSSIAVWEDRLYLLKGNIAGAVASPLLEKWKKESAELEALIARSRSLVEPVKGSVVYRSQFFALDSAFDKPENPMKAIVEKYKASLALGSKKSRKKQ